MIPYDDLPLILHDHICNKIHFIKQPTLNHIKENLRFKTQTNINENSLVILVMLHNKYYFRWPILQIMTYLLPVAWSHKTLFHIPKYHLVTSQSNDSRKIELGWKGFQRRKPTHHQPSPLCQASIKQCIILLR